jgi:cell division protein FtsB
MDRLLALITNWLGPLRGRIMVAFVLIVGMYFVLSFGEQAWRARELEENVAQRQAEIAELRLTRQSLESQIEAYNSEHYETYVAQVARRDLNLAYPGETVMLVRWDGPPESAQIDETEPEDDPDDPNWRKWIDFVAQRGPDT